MQTVYQYKGKSYVKRDENTTYPAKGDVYLMNTPLSETEIIDVADHDFIYNRHWVLTPVETAVGGQDGWDNKEEEEEEEDFFPRASDILAFLAGWYPTLGGIYDEAIPQPASSQVYQGYGKEWVKTAEKRLPKAGEYYLWGEDKDNVQRCYFDHTTEGSMPMWILEELPQVEEEIIEIEVVILVL